MRLVAFCEAAADFRIASELVDRVLRESGPAWVLDVMEAAPEGVRSWHGDGDGRAFFDLHRLVEYTRELSVRVPHGHFEGRPGAAGALMARTAFAITRALTRRSGAVAAVVVVWDMDDQWQSRRAGLEPARTEARSWAPFCVVLGCPNPMREAWVLCGFDPETDEEHARLEALRGELGFHPHEQAHRLHASDEQAKRSAKRVLGLLVGDDLDREARCWQQAPLDMLRARGEPTGLRAFLDELKHQLIPLLTRT